MSVFRTRFAPSPTGALHLGHAFSAIVTHDLAIDRGGEFLVRIEDIDEGRCRAEFEEAIFADLAWLGLRWNADVRRQSEHLSDYAAALDVLRERALLYPCFCSRREIAREIAFAPSAPHGPEGALYPGTCRALEPAQRRARVEAGESHAWRLDVTAAARQVTGDLEFVEECGGPDGERGVIVARPETLGDVILARKDLGTSYHLAVTVDDAIQAVSCVSRGQDLFFATHLHRLLQALLGLPTPGYHHHGIVRDADGKRLATRDKAEPLAALRERGVTPAEIRARVGLAQPNRM